MAIILRRPPRPPPPALTTRMAIIKLMAQVLILKLS